MPSYNSSQLWKIFNLRGIREKELLTHFDIHARDAHIPTESE